MGPKTLKALKASIAKWGRNAKVKDPDKYLLDSDDCPLCGMFYRNNCEGCPVYLKTGKWACGGTPYSAAHKAWSFWDEGGENGMEAAHAAARAEVAFLQSLLPKEEA